MKEPYINGSRVRNIATDEVGEVLSYHAHGRTFRYRVRVGESIYHFFSSGLEFLGEPEEANEHENWDT